MKLPDVNVLIFAHRQDSQFHKPAKTWLHQLINGTDAFGMSELALAAFLRIVTHRKIHPNPTPMETALSFAQRILERPNCVVIQPGSRHWAIFERLCRAVDVKGSLVMDAYYAALAIESGCEWVTFDRDFARFPDLHWSSPPS